MRAVLYDACGGGVASLKVINSYRTRSSVRDLFIRDSWGRGPKLVSLLCILFWSAIEVGANDDMADSLETS